MDIELYDQYLCNYNLHPPKKHLISITLHEKYDYPESLSQIHCGNVRIHLIFNGKKMTTHI